MQCSPAAGRAAVPCGGGDTTGQRRPADGALPDGAVELVAYAHSIDFGAKGYGNLVELASLQQHVAGQLARPAGRLLMIVKSAHVYETERGYLRDVLTRYR